MSGTFTQIYIQIVFAVKYRENLIQPQWKDRLHSYMGGLISNKGQNPSLLTVCLIIPMFSLE
jgi:putative transposase